MIARNNVMCMQHRDGLGVKTRRFCILVVSVCAVVFGGCNGKQGPNSTPEDTELDMLLERNGVANIVSQPISDGEEVVDACI